MAYNTYYQHMNLEFRKFVTHVALFEVQLL